MRPVTSADWFIAWCVATVELFWTPVESAWLLPVIGAQFACVLCGIRTFEEERRR